VRAFLLVIVAGLVAVFVVAACLRPYDAEGRPLRQESHRQLGLPPCTFNEDFGAPCPNCGMTTSFALLMHGDLPASLRANCVGTLLAVFWLALVPWGLASAVRGRRLLVTPSERAALIAGAVLFALLLLRWAAVLSYARRGEPPPAF
jgi:hypothetical protein